MIRETGAPPPLFSRRSSGKPGRALESLKGAIERLRRAELERLSAIAYASWLPFISLGMYLYSVTKIIAFAQFSWILGFVPYVWTVKLMREKLWMRRSRKKYLFLIMAFIVSSVTFEYLQALAVAIATSGFLLTVALTGKYDSRWIEVVTAIGLLVLTYIGSFFTDQWSAFTTSLLTTYSFAVLLHLIRGVYEVMPYVEVKKD
ncbi:hypothetical protein IPA_07520 [Ignicoccus pacificus DSM 13166]|uniref:Uncharacterized protein n=1 Tax=Ignicoccus pacificus DSM 13166 TaxID=940294 RepID=A0A977KCM6_9CREN|nr:hypothetical protein IPA_07520 [Ignicoccus pacificus DSM 13166]